MKRKIQTIISASAFSLLACSALAQDTTNPKTDAPDYTRDRMPHARQADRLNGAAKASELIGMTVNNYQEEKLGKVSDLAIDVESGRIVQVILSTGGFIGIGDTLTAVPPGGLASRCCPEGPSSRCQQRKTKGRACIPVSELGRMLRLQSSLRSLWILR